MVRLALNKNVETHTGKYIVFLAAHCRGGPPWPPLVEFQAGAATEGRPYSSFTSAPFV